MVGAPTEARFKHSQDVPEAWAHCQDTQHTDSPTSSGHSVVGLGVLEEAL